MSLFPPKYLVVELKAKAYDFAIPKQKVPTYISENLKFKLFDWQERALINFLTFQEIKTAEEDNNPTHLLFNMAT